jgi:hypothetical protein
MAIAFNDLWAAISLRRRALFSHFAPEAQETVRFVEPRRLTLAEQWARLAHIIRTAFSRAEEAARCHSAAALQIDLAQYGLITLVDELSAVMEMPGRRRRATVHVLEVAPVRVVGNAIAA